MKKTKRSSNSSTKFRLNIVLNFGRNSRLNVSYSFFWPKSRQDGGAAKNIAPAFLPGEPFILSQVVLHFCLLLRPSWGAFTVGRLKALPSSPKIIFFIQTCFAFWPYTTSLLGVFTARQLKIRPLQPYLASLQEDS